MGIGTTQLGHLTVDRFILGGNPFSGFSHQGTERDHAMRHYFTTAHIKDTLRNAEELGLTTLISRADHHIMRMLVEYWDEGGTMQWIAQTCPELGETRQSIKNAVNGGAKACFIHGGRMDYLLANDMLDEAVDAIARIKDAGMPAGLAGHSPLVFEWAEEHVDADFYMCCYYNPIPRERNAAYTFDVEEKYLPEDREAMMRTIAQLRKPAIHYKVLAAGRTAPEEAFAYVAQHLRPQDAVCVGIYPGDDPRMLVKDITLLREQLQLIEARAGA